MSQGTITIKKGSRNASHFHNLGHKKYIVLLGAENIEATAAYVSAKLSDRFTISLPDHSRSNITVAYHYLEV